LISEIGGGIIYVNIPENIKDFTENFAQATGFEFQQHGGILKWIDMQIYGRPGNLIIYFLIIYFCRYNLGDGLQTIPKIGRNIQTQTRKGPRYCY
jgi:hypothetical protein